MCLVYLCYLEEVVKAIEVCVDNYARWEERYAQIKKREEEDPSDPKERYRLEAKKMPTFLTKFEPVAFRPGTKGDKRPTIWFTKQVNCLPYMTSPWLRKAVNVLCSLMEENNFESPDTLRDILRNCSDADMMEHFTSENIVKGMNKECNQRDFYTDKGSIKLLRTHAMMHALIDLLIRGGSHWDLTSEVMLTGHISTVVGNALAVTSKQPVREHNAFRIQMETLEKDNAFFKSLKRFVRHVMARIY